jgi:predicted hydrolase (HD superfamily)
LDSFHLRLQQEELAPVRLEGVDTAEVLAEERDECEPGKHGCDARRAVKVCGTTNGEDELVWGGEGGLATLDGEATDGVVPEQMKRKDELTVETMLGVDLREEVPAIIIGEGDEGWGDDTSIVIEDDGNDTGPRGAKAAGSHQETSGQ